VTIGTKGNPYGRAARKSLDAAGVESEWWSATQLAKHFPQLRVSNNMDILWQKDTGFLHAAECVSTHLQLAEQHGASVQEETTVTGIDWQADVPTVQTENGQFHGRKVVVTAGAWAGNLLAELNLPLTVTKQQVCYYQPTDTDRFQPDRFPVFTEATPDGEFLYGTPAFGRNGLKMARHGRGQITSPDTCERTPDADYIAHIDAYVQERIPELGKATHAEVCLYTETRDEDFIIDAHLHCPDVLIATGFSGHGFKFCSLVGRIMSELVRNGDTDFDIHPFRIDREQKISSGIPRLSS
jgi:sarcosine oxidase